jgi:hypothetical protein
VTARDDDRNFGRYGRIVGGRYRPPDAGAHYGLGEPPSRNVRTKVGAVPDPCERGKTSLATVNRDVDVLETELAHHRIEEAAYLVGRALKRAYERIPAADGSNWRGRDRVDPLTAQEWFLERQADAVAAVHEIEERARRVIGQSGVAFLSRILRDGWTFKELAARTGSRGSRADTARVADRFRWLLAELADGWSAKGRGG